MMNFFNFNFYGRNHAVENNYKNPKKNEKSVNKLSIILMKYNKQKGPY
jgi:hypothetical protein